MKKTYEETQTEIMDLIEKECVNHIIIFFASVGKVIDKRQAGNILAKVGSRLMFGKELADPILTVKKGSV